MLLDLDYRFGVYRLPATNASASAQSAWKR
jgi:hypothetical protein